MTAELLEAVGVPALLQQLLERRIDPLPKRSAALLARAAVLGDPFSLAELSAWLGDDLEGLLAGLEPAERLRLIEMSGGYPDRFRFTHALIRDAVLERVPRSERAALHGEVAEMLEATGRDRSEPELARLAEHHRRSATRRSAARAAECATAAAALARQEGAPEQAVRHLRLALDALPSIDTAPRVREERRCQLRLALGEAFAQAGERDEAHSAYLEAAQIAQRLGLGDALARASIGMVGRDEDCRGVSDEAQRWVERACASLDPVDAPLRARMLALASEFAGWRGELQLSEELARDAVAIAERLGDRDTWASAAYALHKSLLRADSLTERLALSERMVETAARGSSRGAELRARQRRLTDGLQAGDTALADAELEKIETLAEICDRASFRWHALAVSAGRDMWRGRMARAEDKIAAAFEQGRRAGMRNAQVLFSVQMFHLRERQGRLGELRPGLQEMVERSPHVRSLPAVVPLAAMQQGDEPLTRSSFETLAARGFDDVPLDGDWLALMSAHSRVAAYLRDRRSSGLLHAKLEPYRDWCVTLPDGQDWEGSVVHYLALLEDVLGQQDAAREHFREALECHRRAGALPMTAHTLAAFGAFEAQTQAGEPAARKLLGEALELFRALDTPLFARQVEAELARLGAGSAAGPTENGTGSETGTGTETDRAAAASLQRQGPCWQVEFGGRRAIVDHRKGLDDLACLLAEPRREWHSLDLMGARADSREGPGGGGEAAASPSGPRALPGLDATAIAGYRERLAELRARDEDARARGDLAAGEGPPGRRSSGSNASCAAPTGSDAKPRATSRRRRARRSTTASAAPSPRSPACIPSSAGTCAARSARAWSVSTTPSPACPGAWTKERLEARRLRFPVAPVPPPPRGPDTGCEPMAEYAP